MTYEFSQRQIALAAVAAIGALAAVSLPGIANAGKTAGTYMAGDFHNHSTCSDGSISMQKLVKKATDKVDTPWGLDWFVQAGHGGSGARNCTLAEDASLATPAYPLVYSTTGVLQGPTTTWQSTNPAVNPKGRVSGTAPAQVMWRWQSMQEFQYPMLEYLSAQQNKPMFLGVESVVAGHEHSSMSVITGQMPMSLDNKTLPTTAGYSASGNANALAQWEYCFDRNDTDTSRGNTVVGGAVGNNWNCSVTGSLNANDPSWSTVALKLLPATGTGTGDRGHAKTIEAMKWMAENHPNGSYYVPAHLERAGPFNPNGNNGYNVELLRNLNNAAPLVAFGMETQPGHGASSDRGEYLPKRQTINGVLTDSVGGTTYGGTGVYGAQIGGVWDALLGEGRNFWFFASSDWHNRGSFGPDDRRSSQDFYPGEYQRNYTLVRNGGDKLRPQTIVDGLRTRNNFAASGHIIDRLAFIACASYAGVGARSNASVEALALTAAQNNTDIDKAGCATMGEKLVVRPGAEIVVSIVVRDPSGSNYSPYTFNNPSLAQIGVSQPLDQPVLDHIDVIRGLVTGYKTPGAADYSGQWPTNTDWLRSDGSTADLSVVPAAAKNTSAAILKTFSKNAGGWTDAGNDFLKMTFRIPAVTASQYVRLRGSNLPASVPYETDASGNPKADLFTNAGNGTTDLVKLKIPCTVTGTTQFDGCPSHLPVVNGQKMVALDVAAWSDLWFYSNPIYVQVGGSSVVAGVK
ncbi:MAG: hypothetical protein H7242_06210 [Microbacteriaceae bacterium]|nr:hypothetical protein [Burkholderiaceae bacterium]